MSNFPRKFKIGDRVRPIDGRFVASSEVGTVNSYGDNKSPSPYNPNTYLVVWDGGTANTEIHEDFIEKASAGVPIKVTILGANGGFSTYPEKTDLIEDLVSMKILYHVKTTVHDDHVVNTYAKALTGYSVEDKRTNTSLWEQYPQEV